MALNMHTMYKCNMALKEKLKKFQIDSFGRHSVNGVSVCYHIFVKKLSFSFI